MITQEEVKELFDYDPDTGVVTRRIDVAHNAKAGNIVGTALTNRGGKSYMVVKINRKPYYLHRIIWLYVHGEFPDQIDHINGDGCDNRLVNLRDVARAENMKNMRKQSNNTSGIAGVCWYKKTHKWVAQIKVNGKCIHLGYFKSIEEAASARKLASISHKFHNNHGQERPL